MANQNSDDLPDRIPWHQKTASIVLQKMEPLFPERLGLKTNPAGAVTLDVHLPGDFGSLRN